MASTYWTIESGGVEKTFEQWGLRGGSRERHSLHVGTFTVVADGQPVDSAALFAYRSPVVVRRDRASADLSAFSGGSVYFQGEATKSRRVGGPLSETVQYVFSDLWWFLTRVVYVQKWPQGLSTSHVIMNMRQDWTGTLISVGLQIQNTLLYVCEQLGATFDQALYNSSAVLTPAQQAVQVAGAPFQWDLSLLPVVIPPVDEKRDVDCAEAVKSQERWVPGMTTWVEDATGTVDAPGVPVLHCVTRWGTSGGFGNTYDPNAPPPTLALPAVTLAIGDNVSVTSEDIVPLNELQASQVILRYEQVDTVNGQEEVSMFVDTYPASPDGGNTLNIVQATVNLQGSQVTDQFAPLTCRDLSYASQGAPYPFWTEKHPSLLAAKAGTLAVTGVGFQDSAGAPATPLQYEMLNDGALHAWMSSGGAPMQQLEVTAVALASYTTADGQVVVNQKLQTRVKTTNLPSGTYVRQQVDQYAEQVPVALARSFHRLLSPLQYEGEVSVETAAGEVDGRQYLGAVLNLTGGAPEWAAMDALVVSVSEDLESGVSRVKFGPNRFLSPGQVLDLLRVTRKRTTTFYSNTFSIGKAFPAQDVQMPAATAKQDSTTGPPPYSLDIVAGAIPGS